VGLFLIAGARRSRSVGDELKGRERLDYYGRGRESEPSRRDRVLDEGEVALDNPLGPRSTGEGLVDGAGGSTAREIARLDAEHGLDDLEGSHCRVSRFDALLAGFALEGDRSRRARTDSLPES